MSSVVAVDELLERIEVVEKVRVCPNRWLQVPRLLDVVCGQLSVRRHPDDVVADLLELLAPGDRLLHRRRVLRLCEVFDVEGRRAPEAVFAEAGRPAVALGTLHGRDRRVLRLLFVLAPLRDGDLRARLVAEPGDVVRGGLRPADPPEVRLQVGLRDTGLHRQHARPRPPEVTGVRRSLDVGAVSESVEDLPETAVLQPLRRVVSVRLRLRTHPERGRRPELADVARWMDFQPLPQVRRADGDSDVSRARLRVRRDGDDEVVAGVRDVADVELLELRLRAEPTAPLDRGDGAVAPGVRGLDHRDDVVLPVEDAGGFWRRVTFRVRRFQEFLPVRDSFDGGERVDELRQTAHEDVHRVVGVAVRGERSDVLLCRLPRAVLRVGGADPGDVLFIDEKPVESGDVLSGESDDVEMAGVRRSLRCVESHGELPVELLDQFSVLFGQFFGRSDALAFVFDSQCHGLEGLRSAGGVVYKVVSVTRRYVFDDRTAERGTLPPVKTRSGETSAFKSVCSVADHGTSRGGARRRTGFDTKYAGKVKCQRLSGVFIPAYQEIGRLGPGPVGSGGVPA